MLTQDSNNSVQEPSALQLPRVWRQSRAPKPNVTPPPSSAASPSTWAEGDAVPQIKDYIIDKHNALNALGYIARVWAHYNTFRGAPFPHKISQSEGICSNQSPSQTPMRQGRCHSCASQRHPDTMHNSILPVECQRNCSLVL